MRTEVQIIQSAIGDPNFASFHRLPKYDVGKFYYFEVDLPSSYQPGFPPQWDFFILRQDHNLLEQSIISDAHIIIDNKKQTESENPTVIVSDDSNVHLNDNLPHNHPKIFYLDELDIRGRPKNILYPYLAPFVMSIRRKFNKKDVSAMILSPYIRNKPATNWRFFGRSKEINNLINIPENFIIVGSRQIGKTSLMKEATLRLERAGYKTYYIDVQYCNDENQLGMTILQELNARDYSAALRRRSILKDESILLSTLKRITSSGKTVLLLDELGNVMVKMPKEQWRIMGVLRHFSQTRGLKIIASCFQGFFLRQQEEFEGPFVNFATTMRLRAFSLDDVKRFVLNPLEIWGPINNREAILDLVLSAIGNHPLFLQYFCSSLFEKLIKSENTNILELSKLIIQKELVSCFSEPIDNVFYRMPSVILRYLFLKKCQEVDKEKTKKKLIQIQIDDDWVDETLKKLGYDTTTIIRRNLLEGLELRGLTEPEMENRSIQRIVAPIVYHYIKKSEPDIDKLLEKYASEIDGEKDLWSLTTLKSL